MFKKLFERFGQGNKQTVLERPAQIKRIDEAETWQELDAALGVMGEIVVDNKQYSADRIRVLIDAVRRRAAEIIVLTREHNLRDTVKALLIKDAGDFEELFSILDFVKTLRGSEREYQAKDLRLAINRVRRAVESTPGSKFENIPDNAPVFHGITRACGLREKVKELFQAGVL